METYRFLVMPWGFERSARAQSEEQAGRAVCQELTQCQLDRMEDLIPIRSEVEAVPRGSVSVPLHLKMETLAVSVPAGPAEPCV